MLILKILRKIIGTNFRQPCKRRCRGVNASAGDGSTPTGCKYLIVSYPQAEAWGYRYGAPTARSFASVVSMDQRVVSAVGGGR